jgi:hypothetical protein
MSDDIPVAWRTLTPAEVAALVQIIKHMLASDVRRPVPAATWRTETHTEGRTHEAWFAFTSAEALK